MASAELQSRAFTGEAAAREAMEALLWPNGPVCPHCGSFEKLGKVEGKSARPGLYYCRRLQEPVHRHDRDDLRTFQGAAV